MLPPVFGRTKPAFGIRSSGIVSGLLEGETSGTELSGIELVPEDVISELVVRELGLELLRGGERRESVTVMVCTDPDAVVYLPFFNATLPAVDTMNSRGVEFSA